jgi:hypothetical protein
VEEQHGEERALLRGTDGDLAALATDHERPEELELDLLARGGSNVTRPECRAKAGA